ncbi:MAG TPA: AraD1 family protein [Terracidiphilus sp.]|jgi:hypothetical protein|nr:AraD1 family protein [Terracidiphilus sp.]
MPTHLVQISNGSATRLAMVDGATLRCMEKFSSTYELARFCIRENASIEGTVRNYARGEVLSYDDVYDGRSKWRLIGPIHVPEEPSRLLVSGTGLTHLGSARQRQAMHLAEATKKTDEPVTDSMRMFQWGVEQGRPSEGDVGVAPEWFYKGNGRELRGPFEGLEIPNYAEDGGEEAEVAGVYIIDEEGKPFRIGFAQGNEFSDHQFEKRNYLNLAGSKLRTCSLGPELVVGAAFDDIPGKVKVFRAGAILWQKEIATGEQNMCHSLANIEHHHFKFAGHRQPGSVHVHFFGADALSFGEGIVLGDGDVMEVSFEGFGRPLRNSVQVDQNTNEMYRVRSLA